MSGVMQTCASRSLTRSGSAALTRRSYFASPLIKQRRGRKSSYFQVAPHLHSRAPKAGPDSPDGTAHRLGDLAVGVILYVRHQKHVAEGGREVVQRVLDSGMDVVVK